MLKQKNKTTEASEYRGTSSTALVIRSLRRNKMFLFGVTLIVLLVLMAIFAPWLTKYPYDQIDISSAYATPSLEHPLGCDDLGRDILSRLMYGARYSLAIGVLATAFGAVGGIILGSIAGYFGGMADNLIMRFLDVFQALPGTLFAIIIAAVLGNGFDKTILALGISAIPGMARMMRASMLNVRELEYVEAAKSNNCTSLRIIAKHVFPNSMSPMIVQIAGSMSTQILAATGLSFIGLGVQPPNPEWGAMLTASRNYIRTYPHMCIAPGLFIMIAVLAFNCCGDALRDALDPKLKD